MASSTIDAPAKPASIPVSGLFDHQYFNDGLGAGVSGLTGYFNGYRSDLWEPRIRAVIKAAEVSSGSRVLDFGCATGYAVRALRHFGMRAIGLDISESALEHADPQAQPYLSHRGLIDTDAFTDGYFHLVIAKDVLEHVPPHDLANVVSELRRVSHKLFVCVPVSDVDGGPFTDASAELDITHVVRLSARSWCRVLGATGRRPQLVPDVCGVFKGKRASGNLAVLI